MSTSRPTWPAAIAGALLTCLVLAAGPAAADPPTASRSEKARAYAQPSTVSITTTFTGYVYDNFNKKYLNNSLAFSASYQCTGYVVAPDGYVATAAHCVRRSDQVAADLKRQGANWAIQNHYYDGDQSKLTVDGLISDYRVVNANGEDELAVNSAVAWGVTSSGVKPGKAYDATVIDMQDYGEGDAALLRVKVRGLQALKLADDGPDIDQAVVAAGYPGFKERREGVHFTPKMTPVTVSSIGPDVGDGSFYEVTADLPAGMDGGPVLDSAHRVSAFIGYFYNGSANTNEHNYVRSASQVRELLKGVQASNELGSIGRDYYAGLDAYFAGNKGDAVDAFEKVLDAQPSNEMAKTYLKRAEKLEGGSVLGTLMILLLVAAAGAAAIVVGRRVRASRPDTVSVPVPSPTPAVPLVTAPVTPTPPEPTPAAPTPADVTTRNGRIFISYRRKESAYSAGWLFDRLCERFGAEQVFKDVDNIQPGDDFADAISAAVGSCDVLLAIIGDEWLTIADDDGTRRLDDPADFVRLEIEAALQRKVLVVPILTDGAPMPRAGDLPESMAPLARRQALEVTPHRFREDTDRLLDVVARTLDNLRKAPAEGAHADAPLTDAIAATDSTA